MPSNRRAFAAALVAALALSPACRKGQATTAPGAPLEVAPEFSATDAEGQPRTLAGLTARGPAVLVFYRGHW